MSKPMVVRSTFSGVGGFELGLERAGMQIASTAEIDAWCRAVLSHYWREAHHYADVRHVAGSPGQTDLLCGGFPCQDLSVAGKRAGLAGERSGLFYEFARIADDLQPQWVLLENVPGLLSSDGGRDFGIVLETLAEIGYGCAWRVLDSRYFGVPQRRRRVFVVGCFGGDCESALLALCEGSGRDLETGECSWQKATGGSGGRIARSLNAGSRYDLDTEDFVTVSTLQEAPGRGYRIDAEAAAGGHLISTGFHMTQEPIHGEEFTPALGTTTTTGMGVNQGKGVRRLTPRECERLQSFPDDWTLIPGLRCPDSRRYAAMGNAVTVNVIEWIGRRIAAVDRELVMA
jgi:DNA (cytosine-5)-methyltransferase 1